MNEVNIPSLSVEEIMTKVKNEVQERKKLVSSSTSIETASHRTIEPLEVYLNVSQERPFKYKDHYLITDFIHYDDEIFITNLYRGVLKREADSKGMQGYLQLLHSGERSKIEILAIIRFSKEGKSKDVKILGIKKYFVLLSIYSIPVFGYFIKSVVTLLTLPRLLKRLDRCESMLDLQRSSAKRDALLFKKAIKEALKP